ncbi:MAG: GNAT family N-acetyltransferase [Planctomycetota bacterium]
MPNTIQIKRIAFSGTVPLRHRVLRPHQRPEEARYPGDELSTTIHLAAMAPQQAAEGSEPIGVVTLAAEPMPAAPQAGDWRLRGMAVDTEHQGMGIGRSLVQASLDAVRQEGAARLWCNARIVAAGFYRRLGLEPHGETFEIAGIGPHVVMWIAV